MGDSTSFNLESTKEISALFKNCMTSLTISIHCLLSHRELPDKSTVNNVYFSEVIKMLRSFYGSCQNTHKS